VRFAKLRANLLEKWTIAVIKDVTLIPWRIWSELALVIFRRAQNIIFSSLNLMLGE